MLRDAAREKREHHDVGSIPRDRLPDLVPTSSVAKIGEKMPLVTDLEFTPPSSPVLSPSSDTGSVTFLQPETRPITQEQLVNDVKGIYAGLVMVEKKCVEIDQQQSSTTNKLSNEQCQALIALHRTLLHEHHDFFLASQHPSSSLALRRLAIKYAMPARMWRHGIHSFLVAASTLLARFVGPYAGFCLSRIFNDDPINGVSAIVRRNLDRVPR